MRLKYAAWSMAGLAAAFLAAASGANATAGNCALANWNDLAAQLPPQTDAIPLIGGADLAARAGTYNATPPATHIDPRRGIVLHRDGVPFDVLIFIDDNDCIVGVMRVWAIGRSS